jgi:hypothetical protein
VRHHLPFRQAPLSRTVATLVSWLGLLTGKVPKAVRAQLDYGPFRHFCLFNVDAERTRDAGSVWPGSPTTTKVSCAASSSA